MLNITIEWLGTLTALFGSLIIATHKIKPKYGWILWILSNCLFIYLFQHTQQYGLLLMNFVGLTINSIGFYQWIYSNLTVNKVVMNLLFSLSCVCAFAGIGFILYYLNNYHQPYLEWSGSFFGLAGAFVLASRHKHSELCWVYWFISNCILMILTFFYTQQYGIFTQQVAFNITNIIGIVKWFKNKETIKSLEIHQST